jgi:predicted nucleotidyltransferase
MVSPMQKQEIQRQLKVIMSKSPYSSYVQRISLFGSHLHGHATEKSDIDLLLELRQPMSMLKLVHMERDLENALGKKVDLRTPMSLSKYFRSDVLKEAEPVYETKYEKR